MGTSVLRKVKERKVKRMQSVYKSDSLTNGGIKKNKRKEEEDDSFKERKKFKGERHILDERLCGISCQRYWDDFGFSVLSCLDEQSSILLDKRFSSIQRLRNMTDLSKKSLCAMWIYSQNILGFEFVDHQSIVVEFVLDQDDKDFIERLIFSQEISDNISEHKSEREVKKIVVMVLETKLQAVVIYVLHAVAQF